MIGWIAPAIAWLAVTAQESQYRGTQVRYRLDGSSDTAAEPRRAAESRVRGPWALVGARDQEPGTGDQGRRAGASGTRVPCSATQERVILVTREEIAGTVAGVEPDGRLRLAVEGGRTVPIPLERIHRIQFSKPESIASGPQFPKILFANGGASSARAKEFRDGRWILPLFGSERSVAKSEIRSIVFGPTQAPLPELKDEKADLVIREIEKKGDDQKPIWECVADYGELQSLTADKLALKVGEEVKEFDRATVRQIHFRAPERPAEVPTGWFARLLFRNGDRLVGLLAGAEEKSLVVFSNVLGELRIPRAEVHSIVFTEQARATVGNLVICDQTGVKEFDRSGKLLWNYSDNVQNAWGAVKSDNGNVLIANTNYNQILEISPQKAVVRRIDGVNYPYDIQRLENGNLLVAEYYGNSVTEFDSKGVRVWRYTGLGQPVCAQRLGNGNTLLASNYQVIEVDRNGKEVWRAKLDRVRPFRARRLENGNTLLCDNQRGQVVEIDRDGKEVWRKDGLSRPMEALRLEDGNTLILEQGANRLIEVDPSKKVVHEIGGLVAPQALSTY